MAHLSACARISYIRELGENEVAGRGRCFNPRRGPARYEAHDNTSRMALPSFTERTLTSMRMLVFLIALLLTAIPLSAQEPRQSVATPPSDVAAPPPDAAKTPTGLASKVITPGTGKTHPGKTDIVTVHYTGWKTDGSMFDSSV